jgi:hypothetical protein
MRGPGTMMAIYCTLIASGIVLALALGLTHQ